MDKGEFEKNLEEFAAKFKRQINCLLESDRMIRRRALNELNKDLFNEATNDEVLASFYRNMLVKPLTTCLEDKIEKHREISIEIFEKMIERVGLQDEAEFILRAIIARLNNIPYPEQSEELRIMFIDLLSVCLDANSMQFLTLLGDVCSMLSKIIQD